MLDHEVRYIDFHTHNFHFSEKIFRLNCFSLKDFNNPKIEYKNPFTLGIHPWEAQSFTTEDLDDLFKPLMKHKNYLGLGEIGLDRACDIDYEIQMRIFEKQVKWANENQINFIVLHCVRSQNEILKVLKEQRYLGQALFHDYNGSLEDWFKIKDKGYLISLGKKILNPQTKASRLVKEWTKQEEKSTPSASWPWGHAFLETDDQNGNSIEELYQYVSQELKLSPTDLKTSFINALPASMQKL